MPDLSSIKIRLMTLNDLPLGRHLTAQAGWNQLDEDWRRTLALSPQGCFVAELDGRAIGTTTTCCFGDVGWIAMVLVDEAARGRGVARQLMQRAIEHLETCGMRSIRLDATALGRPVYLKLGFVDE